MVLLCVAFCAYCIFRYKKVIKKFVINDLNRENGISHAEKLTFSPFCAIIYLRK